MAVVVKAGPVKTKTYVVMGKTLEEIWKDILKKGPKHKGKPVAGLTKTPVAMDLKGPKHKVQENPKKKGSFQAIAIMEKITVTFSGEILMPKLKSDKDLSKPAKAEWKKFITKLEAHEKLHVVEAKGVAKKLGDALAKLKGVGEADDKDKATKAAYKALETTFKKTFTQKMIDTQIDNAHKALDKKGTPPLNLKIK